MSHDLWRTEPSGILVSEDDRFRLTVQKLDECARYLVLRKYSLEMEQPYLLMASGTQQTVRDAMKTAITSASKLATTATPVWT